MTTISVSVDVDAGAEATWAVATDWERQGEWMPMTSVVLAPGSAPGLGARFTARSGLGPAAVVDPMVVSVWDPPSHCEVVHRGRVVTGRGVFRVGDRRAGPVEVHLAGGARQQGAAPVARPPRRDRRPGCCWPSRSAGWPGSSRRRRREPAR